MPCCSPAPPGRGGAARLAARGALRIGAGLVTLAVPPEALPENAARLDAVMLRPVSDAAALTALLADPRLNALCAGPGLGTTDREAALLAALLDATREGPGDPQAPRALVLDADALTLLARHPELRAKLHPACVLTPHEGEFARLFPDTSAKWHAPATTGPAVSKVDAAREAAAEAAAPSSSRAPTPSSPTPRAAPPSTRLPTTAPPPGSPPQARATCWPA
jgi:NAD(P)H-hydrate repair Nnr-like enzyme with NAD(P)H-hydrate dehydratase domain